MKRLDGIKSWLGDREGAVRGVVDFLSRRCKHYGGILCLVEVEVRDKNGKLISHRERVSKSFNKSFFENLSHLYAYPPDAEPMIAIFATDNTTRSNYMSALSDAGDWADLAVAEEDLYGVLVGTSATAWVWAQYVLQGKISHGGGAGQLAYGACSVQTQIDSGLPAKITLQRSFDNNSGAEITVREIGWFGRMKTEPAVFMNHMIARDVITPTAVPNGGRLTVKYTIQINPT